MTSRCLKWPIHIDATEKIYVESNSRPSSQKKFPYYVEFEVLHSLIKNS